MAPPRARPIVGMGRNGNNHTNFQISAVAVVAISPKHVAGISVCIAITGCIKHSRNPRGAKIGTRGRSGASNVDKSPLRTVSVGERLFRNTRSIKARRVATTVAKNKTVIAVHQRERTVSEHRIKCDTAAIGKAKQPLLYTRTIPVPLLNSNAIRCVSARHVE